MKVVYYSYWGTFSAYLSALLHIGFYQAGYTQKEKLIEQQYKVCCLYANSFGNLIYVGLDESFREVYCLGCTRHYGMVVRAQQNMSKIFGLDEKVYYVNTRRMDRNLPFFILKAFSISVSTKLSKWIFNYWFKKVFSGCHHIVEKEKRKMKDGDKV